MWSEKTRLSVRGRRPRTDSLVFSDHIEIRIMVYASQVAPYRDLDPQIKPLLKCQTQSSCKKTEQFLLAINEFSCYKVDVGDLRTVNIRILLHLFLPLLLHRHCPDHLLLQSKSNCLVVYLNWCLWIAIAEGNCPYHLLLQ